MAISPLHEKRAAHSAVLLPNGKVLIIAGFRKGPDTYSQLYSNTTETFDPSTYHFTYSGSLHIARCGQTATLLAGGKEVLITGGNNDHPHLPSAELYDIATGQWSRLPDMHAGREGHQAVLLKNGKVLIIEGSGDPRTAVEFYNPSTHQFEPGAPAPSDCSGTAVPLPDGRAIIIGGSDSRGLNGKYNSTELFDPKTNKFSAGPQLNFERVKLAHSTATLTGGGILLAGGYANDCQCIDKAWMYIP